MVAVGGLQVRPDQGTVVLSGGAPASTGSPQEVEAGHRARARAAVLVAAGAGAVSVLALVGSALV